MSAEAAMSLPGVKALGSDVFGTVGDWRGGIIREAAAFGAKHGIDVEGAPRDGCVRGTGRR